MKTVIQELIENIETNIKGCEIALNDCIDKEFVRGIKRCLEDLREDLKYSIKKEKQQITKTWYDCKLLMITKEIIDVEDYYEQTYNQNK